MKKITTKSDKNYTGLTRLMSLVLTRKDVAINALTKCIDKDTVNYAACARLKCQFESNISATWLASETGQ